MGKALSKVSLNLFEILNELYIAAGSGLTGLYILTCHGFATNHIFRTMIIMGITIASLAYVYNDEDFHEPTPNKLLFITGCDSGIGFSLAQHAANLGFTIVAGCLNLNSIGALKLKDCDRARERIFVVQLDVTNNQRIQQVVEYLNKLIVAKDYTLWGVVNNAGVMVFGEFEWQTEALILKQINVNLIGAMFVAKAVSPLLRLHRGRLINISSHCSHEALPGLAPYAASKAALQAFNDAIRVEMSKYGVRVISFIPGAFAGDTNIFSNQTDYTYEMHAAFTPEQEYFYGHYFVKYNAYLNAISGPKEPIMLNDSELYDHITHALTSKSPRAHYIHEPLRYTIYHSLFRLSPVPIRDFFVNRFMQMPEYEPADNLRIT